MLKTALIVVTGLSPMLAVVLMLGLAEWRDRRREARYARQIRLTDAIARELGLIVAPTVSKPVGGPWRVRIGVPFGRLGAVSRVLAIAHDTLERTDPGRYEIVLTPQTTESRIPSVAPAPARRLRVA